jgi:ankyrin repeat protein
LLASRTLIVALALAVGACGGPRGPRGLLDAVLAADEAAVEEFIAAGADVRATEADGTTLLMRAVDSGNVAIAAQLIGAGADVRAANRYGVNPLYLAARNANRDAVAVLLAAGADPNASLPSGETALMTAAKTGNAAVVEMLLAGRPTTDPQAPSGFLPRNPGADPNAADSWNRQTALMWAAGDGHVDVVRALLTGGAAVDQRSASLDSTDSLGLDRRRSQPHGRPGQHAGAACRVERPFRRRGFSARCRHGPEHPRPLRADRPVCGGAPGRYRFEPVDHAELPERL